MSVVVVTPPQIPASLFAAAKTHLGAEDFTSDDARITMALTAAVASLDGPGGWLRRAIFSQTLRLEERAFGDCCCASYPREIPLPFPTVTAIDSVAYDDADDGAEQTMAPADYRLAAGRLVLSAGVSYPAFRAGPAAVRITYRAGQDPAQPLPANLQAAIMLITADLFENREGQIVALGALTIESNPTLTSLLWGFRCWDT